MTTRNTLLLYSTTVSDTGYVRSNNQDSSFAGERLIAICDGMGGHAGGDTASTIAVRSLAHIEREPAEPQSVGEVAALMETSVIAAHDAIVGKAKRERKLSGMGTTVTAVTLVEDHWVLAHIGDSRAYLLRNGRIIHATKDHSYVQHLIDSGRITPAEAKNHPQRNVVMRVLGDFDIDPRPDISVRKAQPGDRWMLCSDGVCGVLSDSTIRETLETVTNPQDCAQQLVGMALKAGSTDNCTAVIADANIPLSPEEQGRRHQIPLVGGAVSADLPPLAEILGTTVAQAPRLRDEYAKSPAQKAAELMAAAQEDAANPADAQAAGAPQGEDGDSVGSYGGAFVADDGHREVRSADTPEDSGVSPSDVEPEDTPNIASPVSLMPDAAEDPMPDTSEIPVVTKRDGTESTDPHDPAVVHAIQRQKVQQTKQDIKRRHVKRGVVAIVVAAVVLVIAGGLFAAWRWSQSQYYVGESNGYVVIYQGVSTDVFGYSLSHVEEQSHIRVDGLSENSQQRLQQGVTAGSKSEAEALLNVFITEGQRSTGSVPSQSSSSATPSSSESVTVSAPVGTSLDPSAASSAASDSATSDSSASASGQGATQ
ncbi:PP2C family protein-serine/threonine phosphatase [Pseudoscardovia radai]|uniref:PP2C family protein-serine/threonine phosphatase n=1 Tax=Pseudoscardovia radai TaxID=987066 RepID=UPI0039954370